jgi:tetratricopeptide (TPR) repeat protein
MKKSLQNVNYGFKTVTLSRFTSFAIVALFVGCASISPPEVSLKDRSSLIQNAASVRAFAATTTPEASAAELVQKAQHFYMLGRSEFERGGFEQAMVLFKQALKIEPSSVDARNGIAAVLFQLGRYDEAYEAIQVAARMSPNDLVVARNVAKIAKFTTLNNSGQNTGVAEPLAVVVTAIERPPSVITLGEVAGSYSAQNQSPNRNVDVTPIAMPQGFARILPTAQLSQLAPNVYELSVLSRTPVPSPEPSSPTNVAVLPRVNIVTKAKVSPLKKSAAAVRLVVANGSGKKGLACGQASILSGVGAGAVVIRASCADYKNFNQQETVLYLRDGVLLDSKVLAKSMGMERSFRIVRVSASSKESFPVGKDAQLVLGKDWPSTNPTINNKRLPGTGPRIVTS